MEAVNVLLFEGFTTMDALGPAEALSRAARRASENIAR